MRKIGTLMILAVLLGLLTGGCKTKDPGSREYIPGKGWQPVR